MVTDVPRLHDGLCAPTVRADAVPALEVHDIPLPTVPLLRTVDVSCVPAGEGLVLSILTRASTGVCATALKIENVSSSRRTRKRLICRLPQSASLIRFLALSHLYLRQWFEVNSTGPENSLRAVTRTCTLGYQVGYFDQRAIDPLGAIGARPLNQN